MCPRRMDILTEVNFRTCGSDFTRRDQPLLNVPQFVVMSLVICDRHSDHLLSTFEYGPKRTRNGIHGKGKRLSLDIGKWYYLVLVFKLSQDTEDHLMTWTPTRTRENCIKFSKCTSIGLTVLVMSLIRCTESRRFCFQVSLFVNYLRIVNDSRSFHVSELLFMQVRNSMSEPYPERSEVLYSPWSTWILHNKRKSNEGQTEWLV